MRKTGNGNPANCVTNLLRISRGENPYERLKGVSFAEIDAPVSRASDDIIEDAEWMLGTYEPRAQVDGLALVADDSANGQFRIEAEISTAKEANGYE